MNRRKAPSVTVRRDFTNNILTFIKYGRTPILSRRGTYREDGARRIWLARLCEWQEEYTRYCKEHGLMVGNESAAEFVHYKDEQLEAAMENEDA